MLAFTALLRKTSVSLASVPREMGTHSYHLLLVRREVSISTPAGHLPSAHFRHPCLTPLFSGR